MLILSRKQGQTVVIGEGITVTVLGIEGSRVRLGFAGPTNVPIHREEVYRQIHGEWASETECTCSSV